ncbi:MAG: hypothetical protein EZS28_020782, partial [Streblomastix strix]
MLGECVKGIYSGFYAYVPCEFVANKQVLDSYSPLLKNDAFFTPSYSSSHYNKDSQTAFGIYEAQPRSFSCDQVAGCNYLAPQLQCQYCLDRKTSENSWNKIVSNTDSFMQGGTFDFKLDMVDTTTYANGNQSVVIAVTTSGSATAKTVKKSAFAQPTSLLLSSGKPPKIVVISVPATHEAQILRAFLPPLVNISSWKATNSVERKYFEEVGEHDMKQGIQRAAHPNNKQDSSIIASFNSVSHKKIADQYPQLRSLNACLLDLIFGVSSYLILLHFLIHTLFSHLIWSTEAQIHRHQKQMNKNNHNINLLVYLLVFSSICGIFNVSAINDITHDNGISPQTLNSTSSTPLNLPSANKTDINSNIVSSSEFIQSSKQSNDDISFYIRDNGIDSGSLCSSASPCKTINYILTIDPPSGFDRNSNSAIISLKSNTQDQTGISLNSGTILAINIIIQSEEYISNPTGYQMYSILTSQKTQSLFTITGTGHHELLGLHFDNLNPSATNPLISLQSDSTYTLNPQLMIKDCIFEQINPESNSLSHSLIITLGGTLLIENTLIQNYKFENAQRVIELIGSKYYRVSVINSQFKNISQVGTSGDDGGAVIKSDQDSGRYLFARDCIFSDITSNGNGGAICITGWGGTTEISKSSFIRCKGKNGGAIYASKAQAASITIDNQCFFKDCESNSQNEGDGGGAIFISIQLSLGQLYIRNSQFDGCKGNNNRGGAIQIILSGFHTVVIEEVQFLNCQGIKGGAIDLQSDVSQMSLIKSKFNQCSSTSGPGGAIRQTMSGRNTLIENTQFETCNSANSDGGSIFASIDSITSTSLTINKVTFVGSSCSQPGSGGAIAIVQQNSNSHISVTDSSFINCKTQTRNSSGYGWGGAIYIFTSIPATNLSLTNFLLSDLSFQGCSTSGAGNNLHIRSPNIYNTGIAIATNSLVTVKGLSDLYTNKEYSNDYMGIDESKVNDGNAPYSDHQALFLAAQLEFITKEYYIRSSDSIDQNECSLSSPCKTINSILSKSLPTGFVKGLSIVVINLLSDTSDQTNMIISSETELNNIITIQSDRCISRGTEYTKQSIHTSLFDTTLFTISNTGCLKLFGLHFDNLNPSSTNPLISIQSDNRENPEVTIKDCIFEQINPELNSLSHPLIITSGGALVIENSLIQNYQFGNGQRCIELGSSGRYLVDIVNSEFNNIHQVTNNQLGGAVISGRIEKGQIFRIRNQCQFKNITSTGQGGAIYITGDYITIEINRVSFIKCKGISGGAIFAQSQEGLSLTIENQSEFKQCEITGNNEDQGGGAIYLIMYRRGISPNIFYIRNSVFEECKGSNNRGGALQITLSDSESVIDGVQFINCQGSRGGAINYQSEGSQITINGSSSFTSCSSISNPGGAIHATQSSRSSLIENTQFETCNSANSDGGSIFASITSGTLSINKVTFILSSCAQPGSGGAIAIVQQNSNSYISITESSFTNCKTLPGSSNQYGWGGAIYINISYNPPSLTTTNFQLTDLSFTNCKASGAGNNLHILSDDTHATGQAIKNENFLTVKDLNDLPNIISDLYINEMYCYDYMGINKFKVNSGNALFTDHEPLFVSPSLTPKFNEPYLVDAEFGKDEPICGNSRLKCQTIKYILNIVKTQVIDYPQNPVTINIELQSNTQFENGIIINSNTPIGNNFKIQSSEYTSGETDYIKRQIQTSSKTQSLFTISNTGRLKLFGLHFDNLYPYVTNPLISIQSDDNEQIPQLSIIDCEFSQDPDSYSTLSLYHSVISINGGIMKIERTKIENYKLPNDNSLIKIKSDQISTVTISQTSFSKIQQSGTGNGAAINADIKSESKITIKDGCQFTGCQSVGSGGAIYAILNSVNNGGIFIEGTSKTSFSSCISSDKGGCIYIDVGIGSEDKFKFDGASYSS